jgi:hypothetical protein
MPQQERLMVPQEQPKRANLNNSSRNDSRYREEPSYKVDAPYEDVGIIETYEPQPQEVEEGEIVDLNDPYLIQILTEDNLKARKELEKNGGLNRQYQEKFSYLQDGALPDWKRRPIKEPKKYEDEEDAPGLFWGFCVAPRKKKQQPKDENRPTSPTGYTPFDATRKSNISQNGIRN